MVVVTLVVLEGAPRSCRCSCESNGRSGSGGRRLLLGSSSSSSGDGDLRGRLLLSRRRGLRNRSRGSGLFHRSCRRGDAGNGNAD